MIGLRGLGRTEWPWHLMHRPSWSMDSQSMNDKHLQPSTSKTNKSTKYPVNSEQWTVEGLVSPLMVLWPPLSRVIGCLGDKQLICTCHNIDVLQKTGPSTHQVTDYIKHFTPIWLCYIHVYMLSQGNKQRISTIYVPHLTLCTPSTLINTNKKYIRYTHTEYN